MDIYSAARQPTRQHFFAMNSAPFLCGAEGADQIATFLFFAFSQTPPSLRNCLHPLHPLHPN